MIDRIRRIASHDWHVLRLDGTARTLAVAMSAALVVAVGDGCRRHRQAHETADWLAGRTSAVSADVARAAAERDGSGDELPAWGPAHPDYVANDLGTYAIAAPAPLLALAVGQSDLYPDHYKVTAGRREASVAGQQIAHPLALFTGPFDLLFVVLYLMPVVILALGHDLLAAERERRTLPLLLSQAVPITAIVTGKLLARTLVALGPVLAVVGLLGATGDAAASTAVRLMLWLGGVAAYGLFWFGLAVLVDARGRSPAANALTLGAAWVLLLVVAPAAINLVITTAAVTPSGVRFADQQRAATRDALSDGSRVLGHFLEDHPTASAVGREGLQQYALLQAARDREVERRLRPFLDEYERALAAQRRLAGWLRYLSPAVVVHEALIDAAGVSADRQRHFIDQVDRFRGQWREYFEPLIIGVRALGPDEAARMPRFAYDEEPATAVLQRAILPLSVVGGIGWLCLTLGLTRMVRHPFGPRGAP